MRRAPGTAGASMYPRRQATRPWRFLLQPHLRRIALAIVLLALPAAAGAASLDPPLIAYTEKKNGSVHVVGGNGTVIDTGVDSKIIGPIADIDDDGQLDVTAVDNNGAIMLIPIESNATATTLTQVNNAKTKNKPEERVIGVGDTDDNGDLEVLFSNEQDNKKTGALTRVEAGSAAERIVAEKQTKGVVGYGDFTGDGTDEIVFRGSSEQIRWYDIATDSFGGTGNSNYGTNNGIGLGPPVDINGNGRVRVPAVSGSNEPGIINSSGDFDKPDSDNFQKASKSLVAATDVVGDETFEILFRNTDDGNIHYMETGDGTTAPYEPGGDPVSVSDANGISTFWRPGTPNHIRLEHPGSTLTCSPVTVTVKACANSDCSSLFDRRQVEVDFTSPSGNWATDPVTFTGQTTVELQVTSEGEATLDAASTPPSSEGTRCFDGNTETCKLQVAKSGFEITIGNHIADTVVTGTIAALEADASNPEKCVPGFDNEDKDVELYSDYVNPGSGSKQLEINGSSIDTSAPGSTQTLSFDSNGEASVDVRYPDVGKVELNADFESTSGQESGLVMTGSGQFIARPDHFNLTFEPSNPGASGPSGDVFVAAAEDFEITVEAVNANGDPTPNFGNEDQAESVDLMTSLVAPTEGDAPAIDGSFGDFGKDCDGTSAPSATACGTFNWPEVGIIELDPQLAEQGGDRKYLNTETVTGDSPGNVGRFIPDRFTLSDNEPLFADAVLDEFTYMGQAFRFDSMFEPKVTVEAVNTDGTTTDNYGDEFWKLDALGDGKRQYTDHTGEPNATLESDKAPGTTTWEDASGTKTQQDYDGQATLRIVDDELRYKRDNAANKQEPFNAEVDLTLTTAGLTDADNVCHESGGSCSSYTVDGNDTKSGQQPIGDPGASSTTELRYGRLVIDNANGADIADLAIPLRVETWTGDTWETEGDDTQTQLTIADELWLTNGADQAALADSDTVMGDTNDFALADAAAGCQSEVLEGTVTMGDVTGGETVVTFETPGDGCQGWVAAVPLLGSEGLDEHPYLQYDWDTDGNPSDNTLDDDPRGRATFGIFQGNSNWIHLRRVR